MEEYFNSTESSNFSPEKKTRKKYIVGGIAFLVALVFFLSLFRAPADFPRESIVSVNSGSGLRQISLKLKNEGIIKSRTIFEAIVIMYGGDRNIIAADYYFSLPISVIEVARRISRGDHQLESFKITIPEGFNRIEMSEILRKKLKNFNSDNFLALTKDKEGYLFPDTYFFLATDSETEVVKAMTDNYEKKVAPLRDEILAKKRTEKDIIIMAALLEKEAKGDQDRDTISGILWKRLSINMALQADAAPETYERRGLPDAPLGSPGLEAILAAINPASSPYLYYIHDKEGNTHYARNFEEHKKNIEKYLK